MGSDFYMTPVLSLSLDLIGPLQGTFEFDVILNFVCFQEDDPVIVSRRFGHDHGLPNPMIRALTDILQEEMCKMTASWRHDIGVKGKRVILSIEQLPWTICLS